MLVFLKLYENYFVRYLNKTKNKNKNINIASKIIPILKYLFCFFVVSTKLTYSSSKFVLIFILFSCNK